MEDIIRHYPWSGSNLSSPAPPPGTVCDYDGKKFPHLGYQPAPGVTKSFCNEACKRKWLKKDERKPTVRVEMPKMGRVPA